MHFVRYEIRRETKRTFYEGGDSLEYIPFNSLEGARVYIATHPEEMKASEGETLTLCKVLLYPSYDVPEVITIFDQEGREWIQAKYDALKSIEYLLNMEQTQAELKVVRAVIIPKIAKRYGLIRECRKRGYLPKR